MSGSDEPQGGDGSEKPHSERHGERVGRHRQLRVKRVRRYRSIDPRQALGRRYDVRQVLLAIAVGVLAVVVSIYLIDQRAYRAYLEAQGG